MTSLVILYFSETWFLVLREEKMQITFKTRGRRRIIGSQRQNNRSNRKLYKELRHNFTFHKMLLE